MLDCPVEYEHCTVTCHNCGSEFYDYRSNGPHMAVYCANCGRFITYVPKKDITQWRRKVKERDNYTCQRCGAALSSRGLEAHHKMPTWFMPELKTDLNNGITLCKKCHKQLHGIDGTIKDDYKEDSNNAETTGI